MRRFSLVLTLISLVGSGLADGQGSIKSLDATRPGKGTLTIVGQAAVTLNKARLRLKEDGTAVVEVFGSVPGTFRGRWTAKTAESVELTISNGLGKLGAHGKGKVYLKADSFDRLEMSGGAQNSTFQLTFKSNSSGAAG
jgi:hypothetical protein